MSCKNEPSLVERKAPLWRIRDNAHQPVHLAEG